MPELTRDNWKEFVTIMANKLNDRFDAAVDWRPFELRETAASLDIVVRDKSVLSLGYLPDGRLFTPDPLMGSPLEETREGPCIEVTSGGTVNTLPLGTPSVFMHFVATEILRTCFQDGDLGLTARRTELTSTVAGQRPRRRTKVTQYLSNSGALIYPRAEDLEAFSD